MKATQRIELLLLILLLSSLPAAAQVDKAVVDATGMKACPVCDMALEVALSRVHGADRVVLDSTKQTFTVFYKPNFNFQPTELRDVAANAKLKVVRIQITVHGMTQAREGYQFLSSGQERYSLASAKRLPEGKLVSVTGLVDDTSDKYRMILKVQSFKLIKDQPPK